MFVSNPMFRWLAALAPIAFAAAATAGPVPGLEGGDRQPVDFPHPEHLDVWRVGPDRFEVTFRWSPDFQVADPSVAGSFNGWNTSALPMTDEDGDGTYEATATLDGGEHEYKYVSGGDAYHNDPLNPDTVGGYNNNVLRLGIVAMAHEIDAAVGDGEIEERGFKHDPEDFTYYDIFTPRDVAIRFRTLAGDVEGASIVLIAQDGERRAEAMTHAADDNIFSFYEYHFLLPKEGGAAFRPIAYSFEARDGATTETLAQTFPLILDESRIFHTPEWARSAVWYQIMIDRFRDGDESNNPEHLVESSTDRVDVTHPWRADWYKEQPYERRDGQTFWEWSMYNRLFGGDFQGVIDKLDYLKELGVNAIYFNPIFESKSSHKYNARTFVFADDGYGAAGEFDAAVAEVDLIDPETWFFNKSDKKFLELIEEAHKRDMKVIIDGVFNHLGDDAISFLDVKENGRDSKFADWYAIASWEPFEYHGWAGFGGLPEFRDDPEKGLASDSLIRHIYNITERWMDPNGDGDPSDGIDGWRLDVPNEVPMPFWVGWRKHVKSINPDAYIVGEVWDVADAWLDGTKLDAVMNYEFAKSAFRFFGNKTRKTTVSQFDAELARLRISYPRAATYVLQNLHDSHDTDRWVSRLANPDMAYDEGNRVQDSGPNYMDERPDEVHYRRLKLMAIFQATYVGAPMIWYGTEVGMYGADDPMTRMPMWWADMMPYENPDYFIREDIRDAFRRLFHLRHKRQVLQTGDFTTLLTADDQDSYVFLRHAPDAKTGLAVALNNSDALQELRIEIPEGFDAAQAKTVYGDPVSLEAESGVLTVTLESITGAVIELPKAE